MVQLNGTPITLYCINHPNTRSQYYVHEDEDVVKLVGSESFLRGVCHKCAVKLAYYRFHAVEIQNPDESEVKRYLRDLLDRLSESREFHTRALDFFKERSSKLQLFYDENSDRLTEFENYIEKWMMVLHNHKKQLRDLIVKDSVERMQEMKFVCDQTEERLMHIKTLQAEISQGIDVISIGSRLDDIKRSLQTYEGQLANFKSDVWQQARTPIYVCKFESVPAQQIGELITYMSEWFKLEKQEWTLDEASPGIPPQNESIPPPILTNDESARKSNQDEAAKANASQLYISFDTKDVFDSALGGEGGISHSNPHNKSVQQGKISNSGVSQGVPDSKQGTNSKEQEIISKLDKINRSQNEKTSFYNSYVGKESSNGLLKEEGGERGEPLFFTAPADKNFEEKQTPELGQKEEIPMFLKEQYEKLLLQQPPMLKNMKPTHVESMAAEPAGSGMKGSPNNQGSRSKSDSMQQSEIEDYMSSYINGNYQGLNLATSKQDRGTLSTHVGGSGLPGMLAFNPGFSVNTSGSPQTSESGHSSSGLAPAKCQKILFNDKR